MTPFIMMFEYIFLSTAFLFAINIEANENKVVKDPKFYFALYTPLLNERTLIDLCNQLVEMKQYEFALKLFDKAIENNPTETSHYDHRAICYSKMGPEYLDMAWSELKKTVDSREKSSVLNAITLENLGIKLYKKKKYNEALWCYSKAIQFDTDTQEAKNDLPSASNHLMRGICNLMIDNLEAANMDLKEATVLFNQSPSKEEQIRLREAVYEFGRWVEPIQNSLTILDDTELEKLGKMYQDSKKFEEAIHCYTEGITRNSENVELYKKRAECYLETQNFDLAIQDLKTRLNRDFHRTDYWHSLVEALFSHGKMKEAMKEIQVLDEIEVRWLARKFLVGEKFENALRIYNEIVRRYSSNSESYMARAECHFKMGNFDEEIQDYRSAVELEPDLRNFFVGVLISYKRFEEAFQEMDFLDEPQQLLKIGKEFFDHGRLNEAIGCYTKAITKEPNDYNFYYRRGLSYFKLKNFKNAISDFEESLKKSPDELRPRVYLSEALVEVNENDRAKKIFREVTLKHKIPESSSDHIYYVQRKIKNSKPRTLRKTQETSDYEKSLKDDEVQRGLEALMQIPIP